MPIHYRNKCAIKYKKEISNSFDFLIKYFDCEPGDIFVEILPIEEFNKFYKFKKETKPQEFIVGYALNNGIIIVLDKKDFPKKQGHIEEEFEAVIVHELSHMFIRRLTWPEEIFIWIQEGICEYLSFGNLGFKVKRFVPFNEIETEEGWDRYNPYQQAGFFFKYLSEKYGDKKIVDFIKGLKKNSKRQIEYFEEVFSENFEEIQEKFKKEIKNENASPSRNTL
jgi:hypothetical protein